MEVAMTRMGRFGPAILLHLAWVPGHFGEGVQKDGRLHVCTQPATEANASVEDRAGRHRT